MDGQNVSLKQIVDLMMLWAEEPDSYLYGGSRALVLSHAKRLLQELNYAGLRSVRIHEAEIGASGKITVPADFVEYVRVYYCVGNYLMPAFENKHINTLQYESLKDVEEQLILTMTGKRILTPSGDYLTARVKLNESVPATGHPKNWCFLEGYKYDHKNNCFVLDYVPDGVSHVAIEYVADPLISEPDPAKLCIHKYFEKAMEAGIYYRIIETRHNVPMHEKVRAKKEWNIKYKDAVKELNAKPQELIQAIMGWKHMRSEQGMYAGMGGQRIPEPKPKEILYMASFIEYVCQTLTPKPEKVRNRLTVTSVATKQKVTMTVTAEKEVHTDVEVSYSLSSHARAASGQGKVTILAGRKTADVDVAADFYGQTLQFSIYSVDGIVSADSDVKYIYEIESPVTLENLIPKPVNHIRATVEIISGAPLNDRICISYHCSYPVASVIVMKCITNMPPPAVNFYSLNNIYKGIDAISLRVRDGFAGQTCLLSIESVDGVKGVLEDSEYIYEVDATLVIGSISPLIYLQDFVPQGGEAVGAEVMLTDKRDNIVYRCIKMADGKWWMGENMRYDTEGGYIYDNVVANLAAYGRLYEWQTAVDAAPANWHLPSDGEWKALEMALGMTQEEADKDNDFRGIDQGDQLKQGGSSKVDLLLGGYWHGSYVGMGSRGDYWSSTEHSPTAWNRIVISSGAGVHRGRNSKSYRLSVRYILGRTAPSVSYSVNVHPENRIVPDYTYYGAYAEVSQEQTGANTVVRLTVDGTAPVTVPATPTSLHRFPLSTYGKQATSIIESVNGVPGNGTADFDRRNDLGLYVTILSGRTFTVPTPSMPTINVSAILRNNIPTLEVTATYELASKVRVNIKNSAGTVVTYFDKEGQGAKFIECPALNYGETYTLEIASVGGVAGTDRDNWFIYSLGTASITVPADPNPPVELLSLTVTKQDIQLGVFRNDWTPLIVDWGDGVTETKGASSLNLSHHYAATGNHVIKMLGQPTSIRSLDCINMGIVTLDVSGCSSLTSLSCSSNQLTTLDISQNTLLVSLDCSSNQLTTLVTNRNVELVSLKCRSNQLITLDFTQNTALSFLDFVGNPCMSTSKVVAIINTLPTRPNNSQGNVKVADFAIEELIRPVCATKRWIIVN